VKQIGSVAALLLSVAILLAGSGLQGTLLPLRGQLENFSTVDIGVLGSAYFLGFAAGCLLGPALVRPVGHIRAFTALVSIASTTALGHALLPDAIVWWGLRAVTGFCFAALYMIIESWLNERATNENRGAIFSIYTIINLTVLTAGQMMITLDTPASFVLFALASILVSLAAVPVAMTTAPAPAPIASVHIRVRHLYRISPVGFVGGLIVGLANGSFWSLGPLYAQAIGLNTTGIAIFMSAVVLAGAIGQWPFGYVSDRRDRRLVIIFGGTGAMAAAIALALLPHDETLVVLGLAALFGCFAMPIYALSAAHMNDFVEPGGFVEAASGLLLVYAGGAVVGPMIASTLMRGIGPMGLFLFTAASHALLVCFAIYRMTRRARAPEQDRVKFVDSLRVAQVVAAVDPLADTVEAAPAQETSSDPAQPAKKPDLENAEQRQQHHDADESVTAVGGGHAAHVDAEQPGDEAERQEDSGDHRK